MLSSNNHIYQPDHWVVLKINRANIKEEEASFYYKILAMWSGGYLYGASWRLSSTILNVKKDKNNFIFNNYSGSSYKVNKENYELSLIAQDPLSDLKQKEITYSILPSNTNWLLIDWKNYA